MPVDDALDAAAVLAVNPADLALKPPPLGDDQMELKQALANLGTCEDTLTAEEKSTLDEVGYLSLGVVMSSQELEGYRNRLAELLAEEGENAGKEVHQEKGTLRLSNLVDKDPMFEKVITNPRLLAAIHHVFDGPFKLSSLNSRAALPGHGRQALHADWGKAVEPGDYYICNSIWLLDDFTTDNGATRVVPRSHRSGQKPGDSMEDPTADHPDQVQVVAPAGTVVVFNSHTWHGGLVNHTDSPRRAMHCYFCRRDQPQQTDQRKWLRPETLNRLSPSARAILDV